MKKAALLADVVGDMEETVKKMPGGIGLIRSIFTPIDLCAGWHRVEF
jgi:hypothetical protein